MQIRADFLHFLERCRLISVGMHKLTALSCKRIRIDRALVVRTTSAHTSTVIQALLLLVVD